MNRRPSEPGKPAVRVRLDGRDKMPSQNRLAVKLKGVSKAAESRPAREPSQADLDRHMRAQGRDQRAAEAAMRERRAMERRDRDGFKDSTRMKYMQGGDDYAKGGKVRGAAKVAQENATFKRGDSAPAPKKRGVPVASREPMIKSKGGLGQAIKK